MVLLASYSSSSEALVFRAFLFGEIKVLLKMRTFEGEDTNIRFFT